MLYHDGKTELEGYFAPAAIKGNSPLVLIIHQWYGVSQNEKMRADMLAAQGYNAFALDMYGKGIRPDNNDDAGKQAMLYKDNPQLARQRIKAALDFASTLPNVDKSRIAVMGYCFGGTMALELARSGADIRGAISFHGALLTKAPAVKGTIKASLLAHHGADDPLVPPEELKAFAEEMNAAGADWILTSHSHAVHAFTQKEAGNDPSTGIAYNKKADHRSWASALDFLKEIFA